MRVKRILNQALLREVMLKPRLWNAVSEDDSCTPEEYWPNLESLIAIALADDDVLHGFLLSRVISDSVNDVHIAIDPDHWGNPKNVQLSKLGCEYLFEQRPRLKKLVAAIPVTDSQVLRFAQRVGFQREGINKASFLRGGELLDQYYVGLKRPD